MRALRTINLVIAFIATTAPTAHALEMISKLTLDGPLWLGIQQHLYRGWGETFGLVEILALFTTLVLGLMRWHECRARRLYLVAALCYVAMVADFFVFNRPVNAGLNSWTPDGLPADWPVYRIKWEIGHALTALFSVIAFVALMRQRLRDERAGT
jgi:uncharacterized membrane protein YhaH (DUF805 family)